MHSALLLWLPKRPVLLGAFLLPFSFLMALLRGNRGGVFRTPRDGAQSWGTRRSGRRIQRHQGQQDSPLCWQQFLHSLSFWHIVSLGVFFCPAVSLFAVGMEGKFPPSPVPAQVWHPGSDAYLPCGLLSLVLRCLIRKAGGDDTSSSLCWALSQVPELHLFLAQGYDVVLQ